MKEFLPCLHSPQLGMDGSWVRLPLEGPVLQVVLRLGWATGEQLEGGEQFGSHGIWLVRCGH